MHKKERKADNSIPFAGSGKLSDYKEDGSWMMNQMEKGFDNIDRGVKVIKDDNGNIQFASIHPEKFESHYLENRVSKIASKIVMASEQIEIDRYYKQLEKDSQEKGCFALKWCLNGDLNGSTLNELGLVKELLINKVNKDLQKLEIIFGIRCEYYGEACVDFKEECIRFESIISYALSEVDGKEFLEILEKLDFESIQEEKED